jgi:hypothetical protein
MSLISLETSRQNQVKEKPRYQNVLGNGLERSQRPPIKGEKGRGRDKQFTDQTSQTTITSRQTQTGAQDAHQTANVLL